LAFGITVDIFCGFIAWFPEIYKLFMSARDGPLRIVWCKITDIITYFALDFRKVKRISNTFRILIAMFGEIHYNDSSMFNQIVDFSD